MVGSAFFRRIQDVCLYRIEHEDTIRAAYSNRENEGLGQIRGSQIARSTQPSGWAEGPNEEEKFGLKVKRYFFHEVGMHLEANLSLSDPHGEVLSIPQQDERTRLYSRRHRLQRDTCQQQLPTSKEGERRMPARTFV